MPDTITNYSSDVAKLQPAPLSPLHLIDQLIDAMLPLIDPETHHAAADTPARVAALAPVIGTATVADIVLLREMVKAVDEQGVYSGPIDGRRCAAAEVIKHLLDDFIICAEAAGPACVRARGRFARHYQHLLPDESYLLINSMAGDAFDVSHSTWDGDLFGGSQANSDSAYEDQPWWEHRQQMLDNRD